MATSDGREIIDVDEYRRILQLSGSGQKNEKLKAISAFLLGAVMILQVGNVA